MRRRYRGALLLSGLAVAAAASAEPGGDPEAQARAQQGRLLYEAGSFPDGQTLRAQRPDGSTLDGRDAACASCHRRSGLGTFEGAIRVPPIAWRVLSRSADEIAATRTVPHVLGFHPQRPAYTRERLARALREGIGADGKPLSWVMPRYPDLSPAALDALQAQLETLSPGEPAGSRDGQLRFALVATPQADEAAVQAVAAVFQRDFAEHNADIGANATPGRADTGAYDVQRLLHLAVWRLQGPAHTWPSQLDARLAREPVFALLGGLGGGDWSVIDRWCEARRVPQVLAGSEAPDPEDGFYSLHFHRGVVLEARVMAAELRARHPVPVPVVQVYRAGDSGSLAAQALRAALGRDWPVQDVVLGAADGAARPAPKAAVGVLWLRPGDFGQLDAGGIETLLVSGIMSRGGEGLPPVWVERALIAYPWELPVRRRIAMNFPIGWLRAKGQPVVDERAQTDAWLASQVLESALADLIDAYYPEYLVERVESLLGHRLNNAHYPRLTLAAGQRFASKGAYLVRRQSDGNVVPEGGWRIP